MSDPSLTGTMADIWKDTWIPVTLVKGRDTLSKMNKELQELLKVPKVKKLSKFRSRGRTIANIMKSAKEKIKDEKPYIEE